MSGRRFISGLMTMAAHGQSLPLVARRRFAEITGSPRRVVASRLAAVLGRAELPARAELVALRPATRALIAGLTAWIGLVGLVTVIAVILVELSAVSFPAWFGSRVSASASGEVRSRAGFENIVQRPLFSRSRQAPVMAVVAAPPPVPPPPPLTLDQGITLKGVFMSEGLAKAFLISAQNPMGTWVQADAEIEGWRVVSIKPGEVVLDGQNQKLVVPLNVSGGR
jgi:hypothetical protein